MLGEKDDPIVSIFLFPYKLDEPAHFRNLMHHKNQFRMSELEMYI
jgi:hypothetical protein